MKIIEEDAYRYTSTAVDKDRCTTAATVGIDGVSGRLERTK